MLLKVSLFMAVTVYLLGAALLYYFQRDLLYFPSPEYQHDLDVMELYNGGETLKISVLNPNRTKAIIYFGGNAESVIFNQQPFVENFSEHTIYLMNYRAYGGSSGQATEQALFSDALALYDLVERKHATISAFGRSLGTGVASYLATQRKIDALALITPYDSIASVAQKRFRIYPVQLLIKDKYDSLSRASQISSKVLIIMAELDAVIPNWHSQRLLEAFSSNQAVSLVIPGADHNNVSLSPQYFPELVRFFE